MQEYRYSTNYNDPLLADLYDQSETGVDDLALLRVLIGGIAPLRILECLSGTGRILFPLAEDGHDVTGYELASAMHEKAQRKLALLPEEVRARIHLEQRDVLEGRWGQGYDLVVFAANAFYELPSAEAQRQCIRSAAEALVSRGFIFVDNDDDKGALRQVPFNVERVTFEGHGEDGTYGRYSMRHSHFDDGTGVLHIERSWYKRFTDGTEARGAYRGRKHPVSAQEVELWLRDAGFEILDTFGNRRGAPYTRTSARAIFWARKLD